MHTVINKWINWELEEEQYISIVSKHSPAKHSVINGDLLLNEYSFSFARWKSCSDLLHNNMHIVNTTVYLKMAKLVYFMLCVFYHYKNNTYLLRKERVIFPWRRLEDTTLIKWSKWTSLVMGQLETIPHNIVPVISLPKIQNLNLIMRKRKANLNWWTSYKIMGCNLQMCQARECQGKTKELHQIKGD